MIGKENINARRGRRRRRESGSKKRATAQTGAPPPPLWSLFVFGRKKMASLSFFSCFLFVYINELDRMYA